MLLGACAAVNAHAGLADVFELVLEQPVSNGVPGRGAGNIEVPGATDTYTFTLTDTTVLYFDEQAGSCSIDWQCDGPNGAVFPLRIVCLADPGTLVLEPGAYTITVSGGGGAVGVYGFTVWEVNAPDEFTIGLKQPVSNGVPKRGAGNIEEAGSIDRYTFTLRAATAVYFDEISGACNQRWQCDGPGGTVFPAEAICVGDPEIVALLPGDYTITVEGVGSATGAYSFTLWEVNPTQTFAIELDQPVSVGVQRGAPASSKSLAQPMSMCLSLMYRRQSFSTRQPVPAISSGAVSALRAWCLCRRRSA